MRQALFRFYQEDVRCKHIILGGSADNGYARLLSPYAGDEVKRQNITLLEGPPFARELVPLSKVFGTAAFPEVFRKTEFSIRTKPEPQPATQSPKATKYAAIAATQTATPTAPPSAPVTPVQTSQPRPVDIIYDSDGQRVDGVLPDVPAGLIESTKAMKYCNNHHLRGKCFHTKCTHRHGEFVKGQQLIALRHVCRWYRCSKDFCSDEFCFYSHAT